MHIVVYIKYLYFCLYFPWKTQHLNCEKINKKFFVRFGVMVKIKLILVETNRGPINVIQRIILAFNITPHYSEDYITYKSSRSTTNKILKKKNKIKN